MLDKKTLENIRNIIKNNDVETVAHICNEAFKELGRLKIVEASGDITGRERTDIAVNVEIITLAEEKLDGVAMV